MIYLFVVTTSSKQLAIRGEMATNNFSWASAEELTTLNANPRAQVQIVWLAYNLTKYLKILQKTKWKKFEFQINFLYFIDNPRQIYEDYGPMQYKIFKILK